MKKARLVQTWREWLRSCAQPNRALDEYKTLKKDFKYVRGRPQIHARRNE